MSLGESKKSLNTLNLCLLRSPHKRCDFKAADVTSAPKGSRRQPVFFCYAFSVSTDAENTRLNLGAGLICTIKSPSRCRRAFYDLKIKDIASNSDCFLRNFFDSDDVKEGPSCQANDPADNGAAKYRKEQPALCRRTSLSKVHKKQASTAGAKLFLVDLSSFRRKE